MQRVIYTSIIEIIMEVNKKLYSQCKDFLREVFTLVRDLPKSLFFSVFIVVSFVSSSFAVESLSLLHESTSLYSTIENEKDTYYTENSDTLAFAFSGSIPEKEPEKVQSLDIPQLAEVQKLPSFPQTSDSYSEESKRTETYTLVTTVARTEDKSSDVTVADNAIDKVQQLIDKAKEERVSAEHFIAEEEQKKSKYSSSAAFEDTRSTMNKDSSLVETKEASQNSTTKVREEGKKERTSKPVRLFNTVDLFRKPIEGNAPKWERVVNLEKKKKPIFGSGAKERMPANVYKRWIALRGKIENLPDLEKAKAINLFFNQWPYKTDMDLWGVEDYWEDPEEFLKKSGDCTDYAITKYYALRELGVPAEKMRVVALIDKIKGLGHAILAFYHNDTAYILDNSTPLFLEHTKYSHYDPKYSVNETYRWGHAKVIKRVSK